jgi:hypothetical protein
MGTEDYSDFDSDSGEEWLNDMRGDEETEETATSTNDAEKNKECGKFNISYAFIKKFPVNYSFICALETYLKINDFITR